MGQLEHFPVDHARVGIIWRQLSCLKPLATIAFVCNQGNHSQVEPERAPHYRGQSTDQPTGRVRPIHVISITDNGYVACAHAATPPCHTCDM